MLSHMDQQCLLKSQVSMHLLGTNTTLLSCQSCITKSALSVLKTCISTEHNFWQQNKVATSMFQTRPLFIALKFYSFSYFSK